VSLPDVSARILMQCEFRTHIVLGAHRETVLRARLTRLRPLRRILW
jgi:hypothetical protein